MNKVVSILLAVITLATSCKQHQVANENETNTTDTTKFFQVNQYIQNQVNEVNKTPYYIYKISITDNKRDSSAINTTVFNSLSAGFLKPDINNPDLKKYYTESIFHDETTKSFTLNYTTKNKELELQSVDVLLEEDGQTVKRIFLRKFTNYSDSSVIEQSSWKPGQSFQINRSVQLPDNKVNSSQTIVVWNEKS